MATSTAAPVAVLHPLDPLTADEIRSAVAVVRASDRLGRQVLFIRVSLHEPAKSTVLAFRTGDALERQAFVLLRDRLARITCEVIVSITRRAILSWMTCPASSRRSRSTSSSSASGWCSRTRHGRRP
jgi:primary-amine oxidase